MKMTIVILITMLLSVFHSASHADAGGEVKGQDGLPRPGLAQWQRLDDMPLAVFAASASKRGQLAVITGGIGQIGLTSNMAQVFDLTKRTWLDLIPLRVPRCMHAQLTLPGGLVLLAGGQTGSVSIALQPVSSCELLDLDRVRSEEIDPLPEPAGQPTAHVLPDGRAIVIGARTASVFDPEHRRWTQHIALRRARRAHASVALANGNVMVIGGIRESSLELVDPEMGISRSMPVSLPMPLDDLRAARVDDNRVWILGGQNSMTGQTTDRTWFVSINPCGTWRITEGPKLEIAAGVADHCLIQHGSWLVLIGGESQRQGQDTELSITRLLSVGAMNRENRGRSRRRGTVVPLADTRWVHDDAVAINAESGPIVFGGFSSSPLANRQKRLPTVVAAVEQFVFAKVEGSAGEPAGNNVEASQGSATTTGVSIR